MALDLNISKEDLIKDIIIDTLGPSHVLDPPLYHLGIHIDAIEEKENIFINCREVILDVTFFEEFSSLDKINLYGSWIECEISINNESDIKIINFYQHACENDWAEFWGTVKENESWGWIIDAVGWIAFQMVEDDIYEDPQQKNKFYKIVDPLIKKFFV